MLSRVEDPRVFESSDDVITSSGGRQRVRSPVSDAANEFAEDEQLHPQHPCRMRKRVLHRERAKLRESMENNSGQRLVQYSGQDKRPMEFVFLSSGEIRAREDCPPGLGLPKLQQGQHNGQVKTRLELEYSDCGESEEAEESDFEDRQDTHTGTGYDRRRTNQVEFSRQQARQPVDQQLNEEFSRSSSSGRSMSSESEDADVSSDESEADAVSSLVSEERREGPRTAPGQSRRQTTRNAEKQVRSRKSSGVRATRNGVKSTPTHSLKLDHLRVEEDEIPDDSYRRDRAAHEKVSRHEKTPSSEVIVRGAGRRPAPLEQVSHSEGTDVPTRRTKRSPKMQVSHLVSEEPTPQSKGRSTSNSRKEAKMIDRLESELQKEKKRVLEKMTQLLDEQGKNQELRDRVEALEAQLAAKRSDTSIRDQDAVREQEERRQALDKEQADRIKTLEEKVQLQEAKIARLKQDKDQLKTALKQMKKAGNGLTNERHSDGEEAAVLRAEIDDMTGRLGEFLAKVEHWKSKSIETMQSCDDKTEMPALLEHVWLEFPQFAGVTAKKDKDTSEQQRQSMPGPDEQADAVLFLKKRLRQREEELRQTLVKCAELKEMCARQCVREADLQNFINEHRLRGNLVIRKNSSTKPNGTADNQAQTQEEPQEEDRQSAKLKMISSRGTNTPAFYNDREEDEEQFVNDEYSDNQEDNDYRYEEEEEEEYTVRTPKVFVQVGRDGVYEHASPSNSAVAQKLASDRSRGKRKPQPKQQPQRVERIRLVPSPSLAQRYERVATPTSTSSAARRRKTAQQLLGQQQFAPQSSWSQPSIGECPPGCGSRPSFNRKKMPSAAARKPTKRSVSTTTTTKGAIGVIRPWM